MYVCGGVQYNAYYSRTIQIQIYETTVFYGATDIDSSQSSENVKILLSIDVHK